MTITRARNRSHEARFEAYPLLPVVLAIKGWSLSTVDRMSLWLLMRSATYDQIIKQITIGCIPNSGALQESKGILRPGQAAIRKLREPREKSGPRSTAPVPGPRGEDGVLMAGTFSRNAITNYIRTY